MLIILSHDDFSSSRLQKFALSSSSLNSSTSSFSKSMGLNGEFLRNEFLTSHHNLMDRQLALGNSTSFRKESKFTVDPASAPFN